VQRIRIRSFCPGWGKSHHWLDQGDAPGGKSSERAMARTYAIDCLKECADYAQKLEFSFLLRPLIVMKRAF
jgi:hypothetical protein